MCVNTLAPQCIQHGFAALERNLAFSGTSAQQNGNFPKIMVTHHLIFLDRKRSAIIVNSADSLTASNNSYFLHQLDASLLFHRVTHCLSPLRYPPLMAVAGVYNEVCVLDETIAPTNTKTFQSA